MRSLLVVSCLLPALVQAADKFYPTLDASGRVMLLHAPVAVPIQQDVTGNATPNSSASATLQKPAEKQEESPLDTTAVGAVSKLSETLPYTSSEDLEQKGYKPDNKNRFYYLPDGSMGMTPLETEAGIPVWNSPSTAGGGDDAGGGISASPNYQVLDKARLQQWGVDIDHCLSKSRLKKAADILTRKAMRISLPLDSDDADPDLILNLKELKANSALLLVTHAESVANPAFYIPIVVYRDVRGCVISGVWNYWTRQTPGSEMRYESIEGVLLVSEMAAYASLHYPRGMNLEELPFLEQRQGSLTVEIYE